MKLFASAIAAAFFASALCAQEPRAERPEEPATANPPAKDEKQTPVPAERTSITKHQISLGGKELRYSAVAGNLLIPGEDEKPYGSVFYVAYTLDDVADFRTRPVTFLYNGGPGSASLWLHMGSVGPVRIVTASPQATGAAPYQLVSNSFSLLDKSDLVFIDAVGTGFSRPVGKGTEKNFAGTDQDAEAFAKFITRYVTVNQRWNSPKFLFGESYGTTRSAALVDLLENDGMSFNGVVLMSTILNYFVRSPGFHNKLAQKPADVNAFLKDVRAFARGEYAEALAQGQDLDEARFNQIAAKLSGYTGLSVEFIKECNLRVNLSRFRKELLRDSREILGRYDARFEGTDLDAAGEAPGYDPSSTGITSAFVSMFHDYLGRDLKYTSQETYFPRGPNLNRIWDQSHKPPGSAAGGQPYRLAYVAGDLADAMRKNPALRVFSVNGLFDLATPFFITEYDLSHMNLEPKLRSHIEFKYYPSGHMIYLNVDALNQLKSDLAAFYDHVAAGN